MQKVLVTGISGFAGSFLAELLLEKNYTVQGTHISDNLSFVDAIKDRLVLKKLNLLDREETEKVIAELNPDIIFHLAALTSPAESFKEPEKIITNNIAAEINLLEAVRNANISSRIIITSSAEIYGLVEPSDLPLDENTPMRPGSPYAVSKIAQDYLGLQYFNSYKMDVIRVRPFNHIGPRQTPQFVVASFAKQIAEIEKKKIPPVMKVGNLEAKRDFTDVRDMVQAYLAIAEKGQSGDVYNAGSGKSHKISQILDSLLSLSTEHIDTEIDPALLRPSDVPDIRSDNTKIETLGWKPEIKLEQTLKDTLDYWRNNV
ncbi:MAG: GDP-mannose 4,6-dehydratase [Candidatus Levyibacteriota bacterium]